MSTKLATPPNIRYRLCGMMFLQYFVQGSFLPIISVYLQEALNFSALEVGRAGAALAIGPLLSAFAIGQLADRHFQTQNVLAFLHGAAGLAMLGLYFQREFWPVIVLGCVFSVLYTPSLMLTNALAFTHLRDTKREFPLVRLWGTIGFVAPMWLIEYFLLGNRTDAGLNDARGVALLVAAVAGLIMAGYSLTLPKTPPQPAQSGQFAPVAVLRLFRLRSFLVLVAVTFGVAIVHKFFFVWNSPFLKAMLTAGGETKAWEGRISSIGQIAEVAVMVSLAWLIVKLGYKGTMIVGILAYLARCVIFAAASTMADNFVPAIALVCLGQALHGLCFGCFLAAGFMFVDRESPADLRGSVQNFYGTFVLGLGLFTGGFVGGEVGDAFTTPVAKETLRQSQGLTTSAGMMEFQRQVDGRVTTFTRDWPGIWLTSAAMAGVCLLVFVALFPRSEPTLEPEAPGDG